VAGYLEKDTESRVEVRERLGAKLGANAVQVEEFFFAGEFLDLIAQDQYVDAGEHRAVGDGGTPSNAGKTKEKESIPLPGRTRNRNAPAASRD
jgi:hypothetical protein